MWWRVYTRQVGRERHSGFICVSHSEFGFCEGKFCIIAHCQVCDAFYRANAHKRWGEFSVIIQTCFLLPPCFNPYLVPSSRIRRLATSVAVPFHPTISLASLLMLLMVAPLEYPFSVSSHLCLGLPLLLAPFILPSITASSILPALTMCPKF